MLRLLCTWVLPWVMFMQGITHCITRKTNPITAPDGGSGLCYGGQIGINSYLGEHVSIFLDVAVRYYNLEYDDWVEAPAVRPYETLSYSILAVPVTVGLNFDLYKVGENTRNSYNVRKKKYN